MTIAWVGYAIAVSIILGLAGWIVEFGLRRAGRPARGVWCAVLVLVVAVPVVAFLRSPTQATVRVGVDLGAEPGVVSAGRIPMPPPGDGAPSVGYTGPIAPRGAADRPLGEGWVTLWILGSLAVAGLIGVSSWGLRIARGRWISGEIGGRSVYVSQATGPAVIGLWNSRIVLPSWALELSESSRELLLLHEEEHLRVGDLKVLAIGWLTILAMPWNPVLWWARRRLAAAVEADCDLRVVRRSGRAKGYAEMLIDVLDRRRRGPLMALALAGRLPAVRRRLRLIADHRRRIVGPLAAGLTVAVGLIVAACELPEPNRITAPPMELSAGAIPPTATLIPAERRSPESRQWVNDARVRIIESAYGGAYRVVMARLDIGREGRPVRVEIVGTSSDVTAEQVDGSADLLRSLEFELLDGGSFERAQADVWVLFNEFDVEVQPLSGPEINTLEKAETYAKLRDASGGTLQLMLNRFREMTEEGVSDRPARFEIPTEGLSHLQSEEEVTLLSAGITSIEQILENGSTRVMYSPGSEPGTWSPDGSRFEPGSVVDTAAVPPTRSYSLDGSEVSATDSAAAVLWEERSRSLRALLDATRGGS